ncbi:MAG: UvrD-helicase domain-containing protein [Gammaproteobacteria bacterium]
MPELNPPQRAAVRETDCPLLVLAGAGSGKTRVITFKIGYLINETGLDPRKIMAVTFTNKAAREMRERVSRLGKSTNMRGLTISTFHTLGMNFLRREAASIDYKPGYSIFDSQDSQHLVDELLRKSPVAFAPDTLRWQVSSLKNDLLTPEEAIAQANTDFELSAALLYGEYQRHLHAYNAFDFDDLILQPALLLKKDAEVRERWQNRISHLLLDEYQDTNMAQYEMVRQLVGTTTPFTAVGDDDQSIYTWRGANPENLLKLQEDFPRLKVVKLEQNYRSSSCILKCANHLISNNPHIFDKKLWSELGYGERLRVIGCRDADHEAERVVSEILHHRFTHGTGYEQFAILYRGNHQSRSFEKALREHSINYHLSGGSSFFDFAEVKDILSYLRLLINPDDDRAFLRIVNTPRREIGVATLEKLGSFASEKQMGLLAACFEPELEEKLSKRAASRLLPFAEWIVTLADQGERGDPMSVVNQLLIDTGYREWVDENAKEPAEAERRQQNIEDLLVWLQRVADKKDDDCTLSTIVNHICLLDRLDRDDDSATDCVRLSTLHAAKGLEYPHVFMVGMEENLLPHRVSIEEDNLEEERRLAYVGITRAQKTLTLSYARKRKRAGEWISCEPSRFLQELPVEDIQWSKVGDQVDPEKTKQRGQAHLSNLRDMLS